MTEEFQGRLFPKEAADAIGIAPATLRKYSQIIEEIVDNSDYFIRTEQNNRTYSSTNIQLLKTISKESTETKKPVKSIVEHLLENEPELFSEPIVDEATTEIANQDKEQPSIQEFMNLINQQNQKIDQLMQMMASFTTDVKEELKNVTPVIEDSHKLLEEQQQQHAESASNQDTTDSSQETENSEDNTQEETTEKVGFFKRLFGGKK